MKAAGLLARWRGWPTWARAVTGVLAIALAVFVAWRLGLGVRAFLVSALGLGGAATAAARRGAQRGARQADELANTITATETTEAARDDLVDAELRELARPAPVTTDPEPERPRSRFLERYR